ncbi:MAG: GNAT family N-acetyltransferase [Deltaproteobacteria bacterium]|nr:GNAT family N-acetyltransferase [Deltaproteobacteria bacterium]
MTVEIRALAQTDRRDEFHSGDEALDLYFHRYAGQNQFRHHIGVTYIAVEEASILGFVTVCPASLDAEAIPSGRRLPPFPVPVLRVARLAVSESFQGCGVGKALLRFSIELAEHMRDEIGCVGLLVDAKPDAEDFYLKFGFVSVEAMIGAGVGSSRTSPMYISLGSVPPK